MGGLETPPVADPAKTEPPPKPKAGYTVGGKKIGRPTKEMVAAEQEERRAETIESFAKALPGLVDLPFKAIAAKRGDHWLLDEGSRSALCDSIKGCLYAYLPADLSRHLPLLSLCALTVALVSSRVVEDVRLDLERKRKADERRLASRPGGAGEPKGEAA